MTENPSAYAAARPPHSVTVSLPATTVEALESVVSRTGRSQSTVVNLALLLWLAIEQETDEEDAEWLAGWRR